MLMCAFAAVCLAFAAVHFFTLLNPQCGAGTTTCAEAPLLDESAAEVLPPLAALVVHFIAVVFTYRHLTGRRAVAVPVAVAGNGRRSISGLLIFALCVSAGALQFILFGQEASGAAQDHRAQTRALGLAALRTLPAAATATFFLGMALIIIAHVHAGGEGGGGAVAGAGAGDGPIQGLLRVLTKVATAALVGLMAMSLILYGANKF